MKTRFRAAWEAWDQVASLEELNEAGRLLDEAVGTLSGDELDVVGLVIERLQVGRGVYGEWVASRDGRDHAREALDEELDDVVYRAMRSIVVVRGGAR